MLLNGNMKDPKYSCLLSCLISICCVHRCAKFGAIPFVLIFEMVCFVVWLMHGLVFIAVLVCDPLRETDVESYYLGIILGQKVGPAKTCHRGPLEYKNPFGHRGGGGVLTCLKPAEKD